MLRLSLLLLLAAAIVFYCAYHCTKRARLQELGQPSQDTTECAKLGDLTQAEVDAAYRGFARISKPIVTNGRASCRRVSDGHPNFLYLDHDGHIGVANGWQCIEGQWIDPEVPASARIPYKYSRVACAN